MSLISKETIDEQFQNDFNCSLEEKKHQYVEPTNIITKEKAIKNYKIN